MGVFDVDYNKVRIVPKLPYDVDVTHHQWIEMSDGVRLSAKLWQPVGMEKTKGAILEFLPYRKDDFTALRDEIRHKYFAGHGFTSIRVDMRGTGDSEGSIQDEYAKQEQDDAIEIIQWIEEQDWSSGHVGMIGKSWGGFNGLQVAARQPEALKTIITLYSTDDRFGDDVHYRGGVLMGSDMLWWASTMFAYNARPPFPKFVGDKWYDMWLDRMENTPPFVENWVAHQRRDAYWKHGSVCEDYSAIKIPVFTLGGWADGYTNVVERLYNNLDVPKKAMIGPWAHEFPDVAVPGPRIGYLQECVAWFEKWFVDDPEKVAHKDEVHVYLQDSVEPATSYEYREGQWLSLIDETVERIDVLREYTKAMTLKNHQHHGLYSGVFCPFGQEGDLPTDQLRENTLATTVSYDLKEPLNIVGRPTVKMRVKSSHDEGNIHVRLTDVHPNGKRTLITKGQLNLNHYKSHENPEKLQPGKYFDVEFGLDVIGYSLPQDHSLEISFSPSYWPLMWPSKDVVELTVDFSKTSLEIPHIQNYTAVVLENSQAEMATPLAKEILEEGYRTREVKNDIVHNLWILDDYSNEGTRKLPHLNISYGTENHNKYTIEENNPLSAKVECDWKVILEDEDITTEVHTHSLMSCDADYFYLTNELIAYNDEEKCFSKKWTKKIKRDLN